MMSVNKAALIAGVFISALATVPAHRATADDVCTAQSLSSELTEAFLHALDNAPAADRPQMLANLRVLQQNQAAQSQFLAGFRAKVPNCPDSIILQALDEMADTVEAREQ